MLVLQILIRSTWWWVRTLVIHTLLMSKLLSILQVNDYYFGSNRIRRSIEFMRVFLCQHDFSITKALIQSVCNFNVINWLVFEISRVKLSWHARQKRLFFSVFSHENAAICLALSSVRLSARKLIFGGRKWKFCFCQKIA
jgi:hypothetical protein